MKTLNFLFNTFAFAFLAIFLSANTANAAALDGKWINKDNNTRGLTKAVISSNNGKIHVFGACSPTDCDWGKVPMFGSGNNYKAYYNQGFAKRYLSVAKLGNGDLCIIMKTDYTDRRTDKTDTYYFKKQYIFVPPVIVAPVSEDCVGLDHKTAKVKQVNGRYKIVDGPAGNHLAFDFGSNGAEAYKALRVIKHYRITKSCFVGRPGPSLEYVLNQTGAPQGQLNGEDCVSFNPATIQVKKINGRWKIVDGNHWVFDFGTSEAEARKSFAIIKKHNFRKSCYVGRPGPSFEYMRK